MPHVQRQACGQSRNYVDESYMVKTVALSQPQSSHGTNVPGTHHTRARAPTHPRFASRTLWA
jgi:hypothetical protein